ncbi:MAG: hypothetical protein ACLUTA_13370 [Blautia wexlerae]
MQLRWWDFCGVQQLKYARELQKRMTDEEADGCPGRRSSRCSRESLRQDYDEKETEL